MNIGNMKDNIWIKFVLVYLTYKKSDVHKPYQKENELSCVQLYPIILDLY